MCRLMLEKFFKVGMCVTFPIAIVNVHTEAEKFLKIKLLSILPYPSCPAGKRQKPNSMKTHHHIFIWISGPPPPLVKFHKK